MVPSLLIAATLAAPAFAADVLPGTPAVRTLRDAYRAALENSDSVAISEQTLRQAEALYRAARGSAFPLVALRNDTSWQDRRSAGTAGAGNATNTQSDGMIRASQSGLTGYRELALLKTAKSTISQRAHERRRAEQLLLADVAGAYYGLLQAKQNVATTSQLIAFADKRLAELKERVRVGRAREADALSQEVQSEALRAQLEESARQVSARADLLGFLVRSSVDPQASPADSPAAPAALDAYLSRLEARPDVAAAKDAAVVAAAGVNVARGDYFPQIGLLANYYGYRPKARANNKWDAAVSASLPIFSFGAISASVDSAKAARSRQEYALRATQRAADLDVRNTHRDYSSALRQLDIQRRSGALAQRDYGLQTKDEHRGLVTAIEVLQSLDRLNIANLALNDALVQTRLAAINLEIAAGAAPEDILK
jgi:outer membrane protein TolC